ncbi:MAG: cupin domain-containing protein [Catenulispora sp.]|nr:cupin domain-containing protein [Catenulispora sp.]
MLVGALPSAAAVSYLRSGGFDSAPHRAPAVQWVIMLRGTIEVTDSTGEARRFSPGDLLLAADVTGAGHRTVGVGTAPLECLFIPLNTDMAQDGH